MSAQPIPLYEPPDDDFEERVLPLSAVRPDENQPRTVFALGMISSLAKSIRRYGRVK